MKIRAMECGEADRLGRVMWAAVQRARLYTPAQRSAWLPEPPAGAGWMAKLAGQRVWVADTGEPVGFLTLAPEGYIDLAFVLPDAQRRGVFSALMDRLEAAAGVPRLWTHASLHARPAFAARGFRVTRHETVERAGQTLPRVEMEKLLT